MRLMAGLLAFLLAGCASTSGPAHDATDGAIRSATIDASRYFEDQAAFAWSGAGPTMAMELAHWTSPQTNVGLQIRWDQQLVMGGDDGGVEPPRPSPDEPVSARVRLTEVQLREASSPEAVSHYYSPIARSYSRGLGQGIPPDLAEYKVNVWELYADEDGHEAATLLDNSSWRELPGSRAPTLTLASANPGRCGQAIAPGAVGDTATLTATLSPVLTDMTLHFDSAGSEVAGTQPRGRQDSHDVSWDVRASLTEQSFVIDIRLVASDDAPPSPGLDCGAIVARAETQHWAATLTRDAPSPVSLTKTLDVVIVQPIV